MQTHALYVTEVAHRLEWVTATHDRSNSLIYSVRWKIHTLEYHCRRSRGNVAVTTILLLTND